MLLLLTSLQWVAGPASFRPASVCQGRVQLFGSGNRAHFLHAHGEDIRQKIQVAKVGLNYKFDWGGPLAGRY